MRDAGGGRYEEAAIHTQEMRMLTHMAPNAALTHWSSVIRPTNPFAHLTTSCKTDMRRRELCFLELQQSFLERCMDAPSPVSG